MRGRIAAAIPTVRLSWLVRGRWSSHVLVDLLSAPVPAATIGAALGIVLLVPLAITTWRANAGFSDHTMALALGSSFGGLLLALCALFAYRYFVPHGVRYFGIALAVGYLVALAVFTVVTAVRLVRNPAPTADTPVEDKR